MSGPRVSPGCEHWLALANELEREHNIYLSQYGSYACKETRAKLEQRLWDNKLTFIQALRAGVAQAQSSDRITQAIRDYCISMGSPVQLSSDGIERIYYSGISIVGLADAILTNAAPANRSTAKATANVGDNGERMGSEPAMGIVTGGSDPTPSMMSSTSHSAVDRNLVEADLCSDCPPADYPTDKTRCVVCPRVSSKTLGGQHD